MNTLTSCAAGLVLALGITGLTLGGAQAAPMTVTNLNDFNTAVGSAPVTLDTFSSPITGGVEITFESGVVSTAADGDLRFVEFQNFVSTGIGFGELNRDGGFAPVTLTWTFPVPVIGFLADFTLFLDGLDVSIPGSGNFFNIFTVIGDDEGTFGLVDSQTAFTQIQFSVQDGSLALETYSFDNLHFAAAPTVTAVPEPGTLAIFGLGLAGLALARRQGKRGTDVRKSARL